MAVSPVNSTVSTVDLNHPPASSASVQSQQADVDQLTAMHAAIDDDPAGFERARAEVAEAAAAAERRAGILAMINDPSSWMAVDLGEGCSLVVDHYCLRSDQFANRLKPRNWELQGSNDGQAWEVLRRHESDASLAVASMSTAAWPVDAGGKAFRQFRILQTGPNSGSNFRADTNRLMCAGIELYGRASLRR